MNPLLWAGIGEVVFDLILGLLIARGIVKEVNLMQYTRIGRYEYPLRAMLIVAAAGAVTAVAGVMTLVRL